MTIKPVIFIPCYNASGTIIETLESVKLAIQATGYTIPIFIFNDRSSDGTRDLLNEYCHDGDHIHVIDNPSNIGERKTTNKAVRSFEGRFDWMFIIHADDIVNRDWLKVLIREIENNADKQLFTVWSSFDTFNPVTGERSSGDNTGAIQIRNRSQEEIKRYIIKIHSSWHISGAGFSIEAYGIIGGFDEGMAQFGDTDFFIRGLLAGFTDVYISRTLTDYRILPNSVSAVSSNTNRDLKEVYMLIRKFSPYLNPGEKKEMLSYCVKTSGKRTAKALKALNFSKAAENFSEFRKSIGHYFTIR